MCIRDSDYFLLEKYEAGISLAGTEVKSLRMGKGSIKESFIRIENGEICLLYTSWKRITIVITKLTIINNTDKTIFKVATIRPPNFNSK